MFDPRLQGATHQAAALRAFHPDEVAKQSDLVIDKAYYLQHQVHAVVSRLCEPIEGLEPAHLAECLGKSMGQGGLVSGMGYPLAKWTHLCGRVSG